MALISSTVNSRGRTTRSTPSLARTIFSAAGKVAFARVDRCNSPGKTGLTGQLYHSHVLNNQGIGVHLMRQSDQYPADRVQVICFQH